MPKYRIKRIEEDGNVSYHVEKSISFPYYQWYTLCQPMTFEECRKYIDRRLEPKVTIIHYPEKEPKPQYFIYKVLMFWVLILIVAVLITFVELL